MKLNKTNKNTWLAALLAVATAVLLAGCASEPKAKDAAGASAAPVPVEQSEYRIGPGDTLQVFVWNQPELTVTVPVRPDGMISTPLISGVPAEGKTATQLAKDLEAALSEFVRNPTVSVMVTGFVGAYADQIRVVGQASKPQSLPYRANMTLLDVMIAVGGLAEFAAGNRAVLVRTVEGKQTRTTVRLRDLLDKGDISANVNMRPGDVLIIPESRF
ncbi:MAG TPA: XrtA/PEP-CTERM system exopolysaccharide export protein [Steroidobacteraceae bacterium]|nr:XrtA/PEP-CTERM system exopolysaccharide export protein [Steroidobacteraceae bacterium]